MVNVAIAGGSGGIGRTILEALSRSQKHNVFVLSRTSATFEPFTSIQVDYDDIEAMTKLLEHHSIHTLLSTFTLDDAALKAQVELIKAADQSVCTKRFSPTNYAFDYPRDAVSILPELQGHFEAIDALEASDLEWTQFTNGLFLDYYARPQIKTHLGPLTIAIDMINKAVAIPVASLDFESWQKESRIFGGNVTLNEFVTMAEEVTGERFNVTYDSIEKLESGEITQLPGHEVSYRGFGWEEMKSPLISLSLSMAKGWFGLKRKGSLNE